MLILIKKLREAEQVLLNNNQEWSPSRRTDENTFSYNWTGRQYVDGLSQKTIGILGFGEIGIELARRLRGWDCKVLYNKRSPLPTHVEQEFNITYADSVHTQCDILVNLLPYFPETDMLINADYLADMQDGSFLVSAGSGSIIDESALAQAIQSGKLAGAALDTFEWEPIKLDNPLITLAKQGYNVLLTPHTAAGAIPNGTRTDEYTNIINHIEGNLIIGKL